MAEFILSSMPLNEIQNHDDFKVIWFGSYSYIPKELIYFNDYLEIHCFFDKCDKYIKNIQSDHKILLVLTSFFNYLSYFNDLSQIHSIYILNKNNENMQYEKEKYSKLVDIFTDEYILIERVRQDILLTYRNDISITISSLNEIKNEQSLTNLDETALIFIWNQLFLYYLTNSPNTDMVKLKQDMVEQCQLEYKNNETERKKIADFSQNCESGNVLEWYTKDSFVYRLVNKAFRTRNIDLICKFRYFIILLYDKLKELSIQQQQENYTTVYRGQHFSKHDLEKLESNKGNLISMNTILSTTCKENVARVFIDGAEVGVLFEINIVRASNNILHPFANILTSSSMPTEEEVLFFAGAVFRIDSVEKENESTWIIKLTLSNETVDQVENIMNVIKNELIDPICPWNDWFTKANDLSLIEKYYKILIGKSYPWKNIFIDINGINFHYVISNLGNYKQLTKYYEKLLLDDNFINYPKNIILHIMIGHSYFRLKQFDDALIHYNIVLSLLNDKNQLTGELHNHIGDAWNQINDMDNAMSSYQQALEFLVSRNNDQRHIAKIYRKIADVNRKQGNNEEARISEDEANQIDREYIQRSELDYDESLKHHENKLNTESNLSPCERADILYEIGVCLIKKYNYTQALEKLLQAKQLFENNLSPTNRFIKTFTNLYNRLALVYLYLKDNFNILVMLKRVIDIRTTFFQINIRFLLIKRIFNNG